MYITNAIFCTKCLSNFLGRPHRAKILSPSLGFKKDQYNLTWTVDSFLPIEEYRILYRVNLVSKRNQILNYVVFLKLLRFSIHLIIIS